MNRKKDWKKTAIIYRIRLMGNILLFLLVILSLGLNDQEKVYTENETSMNSMMEPLLTMEDFFDHSTVIIEEEWCSNWDNTISPTNYEYTQSGQIQLEDGKRIRGFLHIWHHEAYNDWIATQIAEEYFMDLSKTSLYYPIDAPDLDVDYVKAYASKPDSDTESTILLRKDNMVVKAIFCQEESDYYLTAEEFGKIIVESLK